MKLQEWDWNAQANVDVEYADEPIAAFINWLRNTKQWRENPERVYHQFMRFERDLMDARVPAGSVPERCPQTTNAGNPCKAPVTSSGYCAAHTKALVAA